MLRADSAGAGATVNPALADAAAIERPFCADMEYGLLVAAAIAAPQNGECDSHRGTSMGSPFSNACVTPVRGSMYHSQSTPARTHRCQLRWALVRVHTQFQGPRLPHLDWLVMMYSPGRFECCHGWRSATPRAAPAIDVQQAASHTLTASQHHMQQ